MGALSPTPFSFNDAISALNTLTLSQLMEIASEVRDHYFQKNVSLCSILNAKCGSCSEDCIFCAQSSHYNTEIPSYALMPEEKIISAYDETSQKPITRFSIVTSGQRLSAKDIDTICTTIQKRQNKPLKWCASLGCLSKHHLKKLADSGLSRYHHNLETSKSHFPNICTTHSYQQRVDTVCAAKNAGLEVCCGGLFGVGETMIQRIELACEIQALDVNAIPLNFLIPIPHTPASSCLPLPKTEILTTIALFRLINPTKEIRLCGGREYHLGEDDHLIFQAGANGMMVGGYLTKTGNALEKDLQMLALAGQEL